MTPNRVGVGLKTVWSRFSGSLQAQKASPWIDTLQVTIPKDKRRA